MDLWRCKTNNLFLPYQKTGQVTAHRQRVKRRQLMIHPPAKKPHPYHNRCGNPAKRLVKIGAVLLGDPVLPICANTRQILLCNRIKVTDQGDRINAASQSQRCAAIYSNTKRGQR